MALTLRQWRLIKELSIAEMATACGVHYNTYARWENEPGKIRIDDAKKISAALGESVDSIFLGGNSTKYSDMAETEVV